MLVFMVKLSTKIVDDKPSNVCSLATHIGQRWREFSVTAKILIFWQKKDFSCTVTKLLQLLKVIEDEKLWRFVMHVSHEGFAIFFICLFDGALLSKSCLYSCYVLLVFTFLWLTKNIGNGVFTFGILSSYHSFKCRGYVYFHFNLIFTSSFIFIFESIWGMR